MDEKTDDNLSEQKKEILNDIHKNKLDWFERHSMKTVGIFLLIVWFSLLFFWYLKADEITKDPCTICSQQHGEEVICTVGKFIPVQRVYHVNGSIQDDQPHIIVDEQTQQLNVSRLFTPPKD